MRIFQSDTIKKKGEIVGYQILIIDGEKQYTDTAENFKSDSSKDINTSVIYNDDEGLCIIGGEYKEYPNADFDGYIANINKYIAAKEEREYIPPAEPTAEEKALNKINEIMAENDAQISDIKDAMLVAVLTDNTDLQAELKQEYAAVVADTNKKLSEVNTND